MPCPSVALQLDHSRGIAAGIQVRGEKRKKKTPFFARPAKRVTNRSYCNLGLDQSIPGERVRGRLLTIRSQS